MSIEELERVLNGIPLPLTHERRERPINTIGTIAHAPGDIGPVFFGPPETVAAAVAAVNAAPALLAVAKAALAERVARGRFNAPGGGEDEFDEMSDALDALDAALDALDASK